jgi:hypothetical protein
VQRQGSFQVRRARVGNVQRLEEMAVFQAKIDDVAAFRGAKIPLGPVLVADWLPDFRFDWDLPMECPPL